METGQSSSPPEYLKIFDEDDPQNAPRPVIPVGARFQADLPDHFTGPDVDYNSSVDTTKWLGTKTWPPVDNVNQDTIPIGKGRADNCDCDSPQSSECVETHVEQQRNELASELGEVFNEWGFNRMGEGATDRWDREEIKAFDSILRRTELWKEQGFLGYALKTLPYKNRESILKYYFNISVPRGLGLQIRNGKAAEDVSTDDDEILGPSSSVGRVRKRSKDEPESSKKRYLSGKR